MRSILNSPYFLITLIWLIAVLNFCGLYLGWYWSVRNFDSFHHFLGGVWIAGLSFYFFRKKPQFFDTGRSRTATLVFILGLAALAGIFWEFFEFGVDQILINRELAPVAQATLRDTLADLFFDLLGGLVFVILYRKPVR